MSDNESSSANKGENGTVNDSVNSTVDDSASSIVNDSDNDSENDDWQNTTIDSAEAEAHPEVAAEVAEIKKLRQSIDNIDMAVLALLAERFKNTSQVGVLKARAGFAPADYKREEYQIERLRRLAGEVGLDPDIAEKYREFVVTEAKRRHQRIADAGGDPGVLDVFA